MNSEKEISFICDRLAHVGLLHERPHKKTSLDHKRPGAMMILEPDIARLAVERATDADLDMLTRHLEEEYEAHRQGRRNEAIRLSGQFHVHLCQIAGNSVMLRMMKELVTRTSLIIGIYGAPGMVNCRDDDHASIADAIRARDADKASRIREAFDPRGRAFHKELHALHDVSFEIAPPGSETFRRTWPAASPGRPDGRPPRSARLRDSWRPRPAGRPARGPSGRPSSARLGRRRRLRAGSGWGGDR